MAFEAPIWSLMAVGKLHILWPHLDSDLFTKITIFLVRFFVLTVGYYEASEGQPVLGLTVLGPLLDLRARRLRLPLMTPVALWMGHRRLATRLGFPAQSRTSLTD